MRLNEVVELHEAAPALAVPVGIGAMEVMALALGFAGAGALVVDIQQNPSKYNRAMRGAGAAYTAMQDWFKDNEGETEPPVSLSSDFENQTRQAISTQSDEIQQQISASTQAIINQVDSEADAAADLIASWAADARAAADAGAEKQASDNAIAAIAQAQDAVGDDGMTGAERDAGAGQANTDSDVNPLSRNDISTTGPTLTQPDDTSTLPNTFTTAPDGTITQRDTPVQPGTPPAALKSPSAQTSAPAAPSFSAGDEVSYTSRRNPDGATGTFVKNLPNGQVQLQRDGAKFAVDPVNITTTPPAAPAKSPSAQTSAPAQPVNPDATDPRGDQITVPSTGVAPIRIAQPPELTAPDVKVDVPPATAPDVKVDVPPATAPDVTIDVPQPTAPDVKGGTTAPVPPGTRADPAPNTAPPGTLSPPAKPGAAPKPATAPAIPKPAAVPSATVDPALAAAAAAATRAARNKGKKTGRGKKFGLPIGGGDKADLGTANQMRFTPINIRDPLNWKRFN